MSTEMDSLLEKINRSILPMPLVVPDEGRSGVAEEIAANDFEVCRLPQEARAGWLLYAGWGRRSHSVSQDLGSREGSYWHGIYHRMEPDDWNSKYWFRKVGSHPIGERLSTMAREAGWNPGRNWDHSRFVDFVSSARSSTTERDRKLAETVQMLEWRLLMEYCIKDQWL